jgi:chromosome segregation ATPase
MKDVSSTAATRRLGTGVILVMLLCAAMPASAEEGRAADPSGAVAQLQGIRQELRSIVELLGTLEQHQRVATLMTRIRLKQQRLASIEGELRAARGEQEDAEQEITRLTAIEESWTSEDREALGDDAAKEAERRELELLRQERKSRAVRVETLRTRIVELENDLAGVQEDILALEETVDDQLGLR